jgi:hypothetical protein
MYAAKTNGAMTIGQEHKDFADFMMEETWDSDIQSRTCYIYDFTHDDSPTRKDHIEYGENTTKTKIDAKFIISSYGSIDKDQVAYHILFKPSQKLDFEEGDELYYYETDYKKKYGVHPFIGLYLDVPDDKGIYYRWLIVDYEEANQFVKYSILPCDYRFEWVQVIDGKRYKRQMWGCIRAQNSYTSGIYTDRYFTSLDNVDKFILPLNKITESIGYNDTLGDAQRLIISAKVPHPNVWQISKLENTKPIGLLKATIKQVPFNDDTDYIEHDEQGNIVGMWADYYSADQSVPIESDASDEPVIKDSCSVESSSKTIKINGSYRTITARYFDADGNDISSQYKDSPHEWEYSLIDVDGKMLQKNINLDIKYTEGDNNIVKVKIINSRDCIGDYLSIIVRTWTGDHYIFGKVVPSLSIIG